MSNSTPFPVDPIAKTLARLRALTQTSVQSSWRYCDRDLPLAAALDSATWETWSVGELNARDHLAWEKGRKVRWFSQILTVPSDLQGYPLAGHSLRLALLWWAEDAQVYVNGKLVQEGDLFDCAPRLLLSQCVQVGDAFAIALRFVSPGHDDGALMKSVCHYETTESCPEPSFVADELAVLQSYLEQFEPEKLGVLEGAISQIDWLVLHDRPAFTNSLKQLRAALLPFSAGIKQRQIKLLGHAHLDMAWLWAVEETWRTAERTFRSALNLQQDFPELTFCHSTPALYEWMEQHRPDLFAQIQQQVQAGKWEVVGGLWVEPEMNLISGESIARQILYGQHYFQEKFGSINRFAWLPDTFGFTWQLPQLLKLGGIDYFVTQKLRWNDTTQFPHELFQWQAPDGTQILSLMSAPIGEGIDPVKMANFAWNWEQKTGIPVSLWLPGVGDHGGGPTRDMLQVARRWQQSPFFPQMEFTTALEYLEEIEQELVRQQVAGSRAIPQSRSQLQNTARKQATSLPVWVSDLYLEYHRGCYTTHADQKQFNRRAEMLLYQAELWASLAAIATQTPYPKPELETAWKQTLFNQFHDILPGSSITSVFEQANQAWETVQHTGQEILQTALAAIAAHIALPTPPHPDAVPIVVFNSLNWERTQVIQTLLPETSEPHQNWQVCALDGQIIPQEVGTDNITFLAEQVPACGYRTYWRYPKDLAVTSLESMSEQTSGLRFYVEDPPKSPCYRTVALETRGTFQTVFPLSKGRLRGDPPNLETSQIIFESSGSDLQSDHVLENEFLRVCVDLKTGDLSSIYDKSNQQEVLRGAGNQLQAFADKGQYWDAWNIDPNYAQHPLPATELQSIQWLEQSLVRSRLRVIRTLNCSTFQQDYILEAGIPLLKIATQVDWQERHTLVKVAFPLNLEADFATYEIPCGAIQRTTKPQTEAEKAQWEVPAMHWADLSTDWSDRPYGISLLNDCKYGYDATSHQLRLTLLRGSEWPDPGADQGIHHFTYALYPHAGDWKTARTVQHGYELNSSLQAVSMAMDNAATTKTLPPTGSLLNLGDRNLVLMAFKPAEVVSNAWVLRCYECAGETAQLNFYSDLKLQIGDPIDLLERPMDSAKIQRQPSTLRPWQIASFEVFSS